MNARYIVGIDLGTTHTVVAYADTREGSEEAPPPIHSFGIDQLVAPGEIGTRDLLPSVRYHFAAAELSEADRTLPWEAGGAGAEEAIVGQLALELGAKVPGRLVASAKSWLSHAAVDRTAEILPWGAPDEVPKVSPVEASASYLRHVARAWEQAKPKARLADQEVVLTVPASFDEAARALTLEAAKAAGLPKLRLVEEPQAAFYDWLDRRRDDLEEELEDHRLALVVDVGGGTTDLTLIRVELRETGARLTRIAVGDHLMLGGDNMDLALARTAEAAIAKGSQLGSARFSQLIQQCRQAKERLLAEDAPEAVKVTVLGSGSKLIGGARSTEVTRAQVEQLVLDGFFPATDASARPERRRGAIVEFGLPYVADAAITKHIAAFLDTNDELAREALGDRAPATGLAVPDAVLLNGGVFRGALLQRRLREVLGGWRGDAPRVLDNAHPELAVARGAVAYGLARRGVGVRIGGGSPRSYFLAVEGSADERKGVCILPRGSEEGEDIPLTRRTFSLTLGRPVRFPLVSSTQDVRHHRPGDLVAVGGDAYQEMPPLAAVLDAQADANVDSKADSKAEIPVQLITALTEVGTLELSFVPQADAAAQESASDRRWKLEFQLRGASKSALAAERVTQLHPRFSEATERVRLVYGKSSQEVSPREIKSTVRELEKIIGTRAGWDTPLLRELFGALLAGAKRRRRSAAHERVWFNLTGYTLRPGFGYPLDDWRIDELFKLFKAGVQFMPETQNQAEWWILWRRVAGGLDEAKQRQLLDVVEWYLHPPTKRPRPRPKGPKWAGYDDMVRLVGSLEHIPRDRKATLGDWLVTRLTEHDENPQSWWAVGRLGARVPFYGSAHNVVDRADAERWLEACLGFDWSGFETLSFAATLLARMSGDRARDLDPALRERVAARLQTVDAPDSWHRMVREVTHLEAADERRIFGESLPPGLRLID
ncbi:MAG: Hsp70 family protein [Myxococcota bacterium]